MTVIRLTGKHLASPTVAEPRLRSAPLLSWSKVPRRGLRCFTLAILYTALATSAAVSQQVDPNTAPAAGAFTDVTVVEEDDIDAALQQLDEAHEIDEAITAQARELYAQARIKLAETDELQAATIRYQSWVTTAGDDIEDANRQKASPIEASDLNAASHRGLDELVKDRSALEQQLVDAKAELLDAQREPQRRIDRKSKIPAEVVAAQALLGEIEEALQVVATSSDLPIVVRARTTLLQSRRQAQLTQITALEGERDAYQAQGELPRLRIDLVTARIGQLEEQVRDLLAIITEKRRTDAVAQKADAEAAHQAALSPLKPYAQQAIDSADRRLELAGRIQNAATRREQVGKKLKHWQKDVSRVQEQVTEEDSSTVGVMLIEKRSSLPSRSQLKQAISSDQKKLHELRSELYQLEDRREDLSDIDAVVAAEVSRLREADPTYSAADETALVPLFSLELRILDSLLKDANRNYDLHVEAHTDEVELAGLVDQYHEFINRRIFGVRSAAVLRIADLKLASEAMAWLTDANAWREAGGAARQRFRTAPLVPLLVIGVFSALLLARRRIRRQLQDLGRVAASISCRTFWPTSGALLLTTLLAAPWPLLIWGIGWVLGDAATESVRSVATACPRMAIAVLVLEWIRQACQPDGLAASHFGWPLQACSVVYSQLRVFVFGCIPLALLAVVFEYQRNPAYRASLGRMAVVALLLLIAFTVHRLFRAQGGVFTDVREERVIRLRNFRHALMVSLPAALAVLTIVGFQFTAFQLTINLLRTLQLIFLLLIVAGLLFRWVQLRRRRLRWQQLAETSQRKDAQDSELGDPDALAAREEVADLAAMGRQSRRLITVTLALVGVFGLSAIWADFFPALQPLLDHQLWTVADVGGGVIAITVSSVIACMLVVALAVVARRNIPGLVDFVLLGRFGIESSTRYAISKLTQYSIVLVTVLYACHLMGITWAKSQWLIAALSVGLGFGLQEVVSNFVCGILLLFERPIRVGDTVTLGDTTGVVIRIRSRATTVRNWDRQEVVIPNKELITARITNWTLTDQLNRIVLQIGIAYGSDTHHARDVLTQIVADNSDVLEDPPPQVAFEQFGDNSLQFIVKAHLANIDMATRLETIHELNTAINERFAEEGIEIPFPQRVLHLRSVDPSAQLSGVAAEKT
jgi:potassium efflux system protein